MFEKEKGFTLLELLVVVTIIGLLATIAFAALQQARARARDAERIANIRVIQQVLEMYHEDHGEYPDQSIYKGGDPLFIWDKSATWNSFYQNYLSEYINHLPEDPHVTTAFWGHFYYKRGNSAFPEILHCPPINGRINGYTILFTSEATDFDLREAFDNPGHLPIGAKRYCVHPD